jgi:hypothetical protein
MNNIRIKIMAMILPIILAIILPMGSARASGCTALIHIGDSLSIPNQPLLKSEYEKNGFVNVHITAGNGRSITGSRASDGTSGLDAVRYWKARTPEGRCWVVALGTNDASSRNKTERIVKMVGALGNDRAMWVNVSMSSNARQNYNGFNAFVWNYLLVESRLRVYDWASDVRPSWFAPDKIHYTNEGSRQRARLIPLNAKRLLP